MISRLIAKTLLLCAATFSVGAKPFYEQAFPLVYAGETMTRSEAERLVGRDSVDSRGGRRLLEEYMLRLGEARRAGYGAIVENLASTASMRNDMMVALITADSVDLQITPELIGGYFYAHREEFGWPQPHAKGLLLLARNAEQLDSALAAGDYGARRDVVVMEIVAAKGENAYVDSLVFNVRGRSYDSYYPSAAVVDVRLLDAPEESSDVSDAVGQAVRRDLYAAWIERLRRRVESD